MHKWVRYTDAFLVLFSVVLVLAADERADEDLVKPVLSASPRIIIGGILATLGLFIAASSGIGGGGILVPIYILVKPLHPHMRPLTIATQLRQITCCVGDGHLPYLRNCIVQHHDPWRLSGEHLSVCQ